LEHPGRHWYAHGKLLITGEYAVLHGATAFACPALKGQRMTVAYPGGEPVLYWLSREQGKTWFEASFTLPHLDPLDASDPNLSLRLHDMLLTIREMRPGFMQDGQQVHVTTDLDFPRLWGLGTSSTLITLLAGWAGVDPYLLLDRTFGGSGYDIACATARSPILYSRNGPVAQIRPVNFHPPFLDALYLAFSGNKQDSGKETREYLNRQTSSNTLIAEITEISEALWQCDDLHAFQALLERHDQCVAALVNKEPVIRQFPDFKGYVKSLGAWGGDFLLFLFMDGKGELENYLAARGIGPVYHFTDLLYTSAIVKNASDPWD